MKSRYVNKLVALGISLGMCLTTTPVEAFLASVKAVGMGGTGVAYPQDAFAGAFNPAGMVEVGDRADIGVHFVHTKSRGIIEGTQLPVPGQNGSFNGSEIGTFINPEFAINKNFCICGAEFSAGIMLYNRAHVNTKYHHVFAALGTKHLELDYTQEFISPQLSYKINDCHSVGIALNLVGQSLRVNGLERLANPPPPLPQNTFSISPNHLTDRDRPFAYGVGVTFGWLGHFFCDRLSIGATFQPKISMGKFHGYKGFLAQHGKLDCPQTWSVGLAYAVLPCVNVTFDVQQFAWDRVKSIHNRLVDNLANPSTRLGTSRGTGFGWKNQTFYRVGIDWTFNENLTFRMGYRHSGTPIRKSQTATNLMTSEVSQDYITVGASWRPMYCTDFCSNWAFLRNGEFSLYYAHGFSHTLHGSATSIPPTLGGGRASLKQSRDLVGLAYGMCF